MKNWQKIGVAFLVILLVLQFVKPTKNQGAALTENDILHSINVPANVQKILETSCFDCHSNHTNYPWYTNIQPVGLWIQHHVDEGKEELNFSEFKTYKIKRQKHKLEEISKQINEHEMPLSSFTLIHKNAALTSEQILLLVNWANVEFEKMILPEAEKK